MNTRIVKIACDKKDTSMKILKTSCLPEPTFVKFEEKYLSSNPYEIFVGLDIYGQAVYINLYDLPHAIISGGTNGGKSTTGYSWYVQLRRHKENKIILCDFKRVTFKSLVKYNNNKPCINTKGDFIKMLSWCVNESTRRIDLFNKYDECENLKEYNQLVGKTEQLKNIFIFIDELAMIMTDKDKNIDLIQTLSQTGRSQGIYLIVLTQRPSVKTIPAEARANFNIRISSFQSDKNTSEMAVGDYSASDIPDIVGRNILKKAGEKIEVQAVYLNKKDIGKYLEVKK